MVVVASWCRVGEAIIDASLVQAVEVEVVYYLPCLWRPTCPLIPLSRVSCEQRVGETCWAPRCNCTSASNVALNSLVQISKPQLNLFRNILLKATGQTWKLQVIQLLNAKTDSTIRKYIWNRMKLLMISLKPYIKGKDIRDLRFHVNTIKRM